jgi:hypothetical protein
VDVTPASPRSSTRRREHLTPEQDRAARAAILDRLMSEIVLDVLADVAAVDQQVRAALAPEKPTEKRDAA